MMKCHIFKLRYLIYFLSLLLVFCIVFGMVYLHYNNKTEFSHGDIIYNYFPFRSWFLNQLAQGIFPRWDPMMGIGRFAEHWTTIPLDVLTPVEFIFNLTPSTLYTIQTFIVGLAAWSVFRLFKFPPFMAALGAAAFLLAPVTCYFLPYYIHSGAYIFYLLVGSFLFKFFQTKKKTYLTYAFASALIFSVGPKLELLFMAGLTLTTSVSVYWFIYCRQTISKTSLCGVLITLYLPFLCNLWGYENVLDAARYSIRTQHQAFDFIEMIRSLMWSFFNSHWALLVATWACFAVRHKKIRQTIAIILLLISVTIGLMGHDSTNETIAYCAALLLSLFLNTSNDEKFEKKVLCSLVVLIYFMRPSPGEVEETMILHSRISEEWRCLLVFFATLGVSTSGKLPLVRWTLVLMWNVFFLRTIGLVLLSHTLGMLWLPARDNFLIEFPIAILFTIGVLQILIKIASLNSIYLNYGWGNPQVKSQPMRGWVFLATGALEVFVVLLFMLPAFIRSDNVKPPKHISLPLLSQKIDLQMTSLAEKLNFDSVVPPRIFGFFHSMGKRHGIADVREYQTFLSMRYGSYSIAHRWKLPLESIQNVGATTNALSSDFLKLIKKTKSLVSLAPIHYDFQRLYISYLVSGVPALNCVHLRLLGIQFMEGRTGQYHHTNEAVYNHLYSLTDPDSEQLTPDVLNSIEQCGFPLVKIGERNYWKVTNHMPRAFFIQGVSEEQLNEKALRSLRLYKGHLTIHGTNSYPWKSAKITTYEPNRVEIEVNSHTNGVLVLTDLYNEKWQVKVNNTADVLFPAFYLFRGVSLPAGNHRVDLVISGIHWLIKTIIFLAGIAVFFIFIRRKNH